MINFKTSFPGANNVLIYFTGPAVGGLSEIGWGSNAGFVENDYPRIYTFERAPPGGERNVYSGKGWPVDNKWHCLQWQLDGSKGPDGNPRHDSRLWIDGAAVADFNPASEIAHWQFGTWDTLRIGIWVWHAQPGGTQPIEMWIDDLAVDGSMIPCPQR